MKLIKEFLRLESSAGICLIGATVLALIAANCQFSDTYNTFLKTHFSIAFGDYQLSKPVLLWVNDGLMAIFFFLIGLELKRELKVGHLAKLEQVIFPAMAALGGIFCPALIFYLYNYQHPELLPGWAIPAATDIAFALGILSLCGKSVPTWARLFLLALAIFDDILVIVIIGIFYSKGISLVALSLAAISVIAMVIMNLYGVRRILPYMIFTIFLWACVLKSGVHATLAGVVAAMCIPLSNRTLQLEHELHPWVAFMILPFFAFANTGIDLHQLLEYGLGNRITIGIILGLFFGKQIGVFIFSLVGILLFRVKLPEGFSLWILYGLSVLSGIGFTMSLFISSLAYSEIEYILQSRAGVLIGSILSAIVAMTVLRICFRKRKHSEPVQA